MELLRKPKAVPDDNLGIRILWNEDTNYFKAERPGSFVPISFSFCLWTLNSSRTIPVHVLSFLRAEMYTRYSNPCNHPLDWLYF